MTALLPSVVPAWGRLHTKSLKSKSYRCEMRRGWIRAAGSKDIGLRLINRKCFHPLSEIMRWDTSCGFRQYRHLRCSAFKDNLIAYVLIYRAPPFSFLPCFENSTKAYYRVGQRAVYKPTAVASTEHITRSYWYLWWSLENITCLNYYLRL